MLIKKYEIAIDIMIEIDNDEQSVDRVILTDDATFHISIPRDPN